MPGSRRPRYLTAALRHDLARKMAFVDGVRVAPAVRLLRTLV